MARLAITKAILLGWPELMLSRRALAIWRRCRLSSRSVTVAGVLAGIAVWWVLRMAVWRGATNQSAGSEGSPEFAAMHRSMVR